MLFDPCERLIELELECMETQRLIDEVRRTCPYNFNLARELNHREAKLLVKRAEIDRLKRLISHPEQEFA